MGTKNKKEKAGGITVPSITIRRLLVECAMWNNHSSAEDFALSLLGI